MEEYNEGEDYEEIMFDACDRGDIETIKFLHEHGESISDAMCHSAAISGNLELTKYCYEGGRLFSGCNFDDLDDIGSVEILNYVMDEVGHNEVILSNLQTSKNLECFKLLIDRFDGDIDFKDLIEWHNDNFEIFKYIIETYNIKPILKSVAISKNEDVKNYCIRFFYTEDEIREYKLKLSFFSKTVKCKN